MDRFDRVFQLNNILQAARLPIPRRRLEQELECSRATVKRIIEDLRDFLGAPIKFDRKRNGYYYDHSEQQLFELPGLWFNASELYALLSAQQLLANTQPGLLDRHLQPLRKRIDQILKIQHAGGSQVARRIRILQMAARPAGEWFQTVAGAVAQRRCLMIDYYNREQDRTTQRRISPQRLVHYRDNWYLDAWCHLRKGLRTFALDAIRHARVLEQTARDIPDDRLQTHFGSAYGIFAGKADRTAVLRFNGRRARWVAKEQWHSSQQGRFLEDGSYELRVPYHDARELIMDIMKYGPDVEVVAPKALRSEVQQLLKDAAALY